MHVGLFINKRLKTTIPKTMKRTVLLFIAILAYYYSNAQNTPWSTSGNIGIGTTNPYAILDVEANSAFQRIVSATNNNAFLQVINGGGSTYFGNESNGGGTLLSGSLPFASVFGTNGTHALQLGTNSTTRLTIDLNGNVGVGTTTPGANLDISSPGASIAAIRLEANNAPAYGVYNIIRSENLSGTGLITFMDQWGASIANWGSNNKIGMSLFSGFDANLTLFNTQSTAAIKFNTNGSSYLNGGNVIIGKTTQQNTSYLLDIYGTARANAIVVNSGGADFVFEPTYHLNSLSWLAKYINQNHHLPEIASAKQMQADGLNLGDNQIKLLQKVEELTLYLIEKDKKQKEDENKMQSQQNEIKSQQEEITLLKQQVQSLIKTVNKNQTN
jgi:hypothetical protein